MAIIVRPRRAKLIVLLASAAACSDQHPPATAPANQLTSHVIVSAPIVMPSASVTGVGGLTATRISSSPVVYVSLPPGSIPGGASATITDDATSQSLIVTMFNGGFDPVALPANVGDELKIVVHGAAGAVLANLSIGVPPHQPPAIVRTDPPQGMTDVPLNTRLFVVFSEPVDRALSTNSIQLSKGTVPVDGIVVLDASGILAEFVANTGLEPKSGYQLLITNPVRDLNGDPLESPTLITFTTGDSVVNSGPANVRVPFSTRLVIGDTARLSATDTLGNPIAGDEVSWMSDAPTVASVSATGLVTALGVGHAHIIVMRSGGVAAAGVWVNVPGPAQPPTGRLAFVSNVDGKAQLYIVNVDGSGLTRVTHDTASYSRPTWSPDATRLAAVRDGQGVVVMQSDGSGATLVAPGGLSPAWTVDGQRIRYAIGTPDTLVEIDEVTADGSQRTRLCSGIFGDGYYGPDHIDWSPDRKRAAFLMATFPPAGTGDPMISVFGNDDHCQGATFLSEGGSPAWSPDGQVLAIWSGVVGYRGTQPVNYFNGIRALNGPTIFADDEGYMSIVWPSSKFSWSPDGTYLAFVRDALWLGPGRQLWITAGNGTGAARRVGAETGLVGWDPAWAPR